MGCYSNTAQVHGKQSDTDDGCSYMIVQVKYKVRLDMTDPPMHAYSSMH